ncbi:MAG: GIY-YIG nuclease family protein [Paenirhodobacter sp.]|uniref:GIY-YIG nuclease family protein n=1 Tax=Paenirhodobacter sp. TaxID=1965326 RepID=UPI003D11B841
MTAGYVYALRSDHCPLVKVGRSNTLPYRRLRELNTSENYGPLGPWEIISFLEVVDAVKVETFLHRSIREKNSAEFPGCKELFELAPASALALFDQIPEAEIRGFDRVARLHTTETLESYLADIFRASGLEHMLAQQGIWTLSLFPATAGGRYFTLNIDRHEVAFSTLPREGRPARHMLMLDPLVWEFPAVRDWLFSHHIEALGYDYPSGLDRQFPVIFAGTLPEAREFLSLEGVRRALLAYWYDLLLQASDAERGSLHARHHNLAAVQSIMRLRAQQRLNRQ